MSQMTLLLDSGADVNTKHTLGWTPLHTAVINGNLRGVKLLLERGADVNTRDEFSTTSRVAHQHGMSPERGEQLLWLCDWCLFASMYM